MTTGDKVANFSIATSETWKDKVTGEKKEKTEWHNLVLWRQLAEIAAKYVHKGDLLYVEGKITQRSWEKDGQKHYITEIVVNQMTMLGSKNRDNAAPAQHESAAADFTGGPSAPKSAPAKDEEDTLPF